jgi:hypothetical protein
VHASDVPDLERAAKCALPLIFTHQDHPEYPGTQGTCTALRAGNQTYFVTAAHVVNGCSPHTLVDVAVGFRDRQERCRIGTILVPKPASEEFEAVCDLAIMRPVTVPAFVPGHSESYDLARVVRMTSVPDKAPFAMCGYPSNAPGCNTFDYIERRITFGLHAAVGTYAGQSPIVGHHLLEVSTAHCGGPNGLSGGPVFRLVQEASTGTWEPVFAGIVTMGSHTHVHFMDVAYLATFMLREMS